MKSLVVKNKHKMCLAKAHAKKFMCLLKNECTNTVPKFRKFTPNSFKNYAIFSLPLPLPPPVSKNQKIINPYPPMNQQKSGFG